MITQRAPHRHDRDAPELEPKRRPALRVVDDEVVAPSRRTTPAGVVGTLLVLLLFACIFGIVVFQVFLVQTQSHLDDVNEKISAQVSTQKQLRLDTADLEAPNRIEKDAKDRLGMIPPNDIGYLQAKADDDAKAAFDPAKEPVPTTTVAPPPTAVAPATSSGAKPAAASPKTGSAAGTSPSTTAGKTTTSSAKPTSSAKTGTTTAPTTSKTITPPTTKPTTSPTATAKTATTR